jgi:hypothetical protein
MGEVLSGCAVRAVIQREKAARKYDDVAAWLERLAESTERSSRGGLGSMFADTQADAYRAAARILREHPEVVSQSDAAVTP